jgi:hypothetical protein
VEGAIRHLLAIKKAGYAHRAALRGSGLSQPALRSCFAAPARNTRCGGRDQTTCRANQQKAVQPLAEKYSA